jgi:sulfofructose kinase
MDTICSVRRFPSPNSKTAIESVRVEPGGQVATALAACRSFGLSARYIGSVGDDGTGRAQLESLRRSGLDIEHVRVAAGAATQFAVILLEQGVGERTILWHHDPRLNYPVSELPRDLILSGRVLHLDGCDSAAALQAARWARAAGVPVVIDIDELYDESTEELLRHVDYLIAAADFVAQLMPGVADNNAEEAAREIAARYGCPVVGITLGDRGAIFSENGRPLRAPGFAIDVADTTGAGDVFHGAFIYGMLQRWPLADIARFANAAAALKCTRIGARRGIPSLDEVLRFIRERGQPL